MIFFGKKNIYISGFGIKFDRKIRRVSATDYIPHYYLVLKFGRKIYWIGYNRLKRIKRDKLYELDGKKIKYPIK